MFDKSNELWIEATVDEFQWTNPHTWIQVTSGEDDKKVRWSMEGGSPNILARNGWKRTSLKPGDKVKILFYPLRDGKPGGSFVEVHKADGSVLYYHG